MYPKNNNFFYVFFNYEALNTLNSFRICLFALLTTTPQSTIFYTDENNEINATTGIFLSIISYYLTVLFLVQVLRLVK